VIARSDLFNRIAGRVAATARRTGRVFSTIKVVLVLGGGMLTGAGKFIPSGGAGAVPWAGIVGWTGVVFVFVGGVTLLWLDRDQNAALAEAAEAMAQTEAERDSMMAVRAERDEAEDVLFRQARLVALAAALREAAEEVLSGGPGDEEARRARLGRILDLVVSLRTSLFRMSDERWNFAVYLHDSTKGLLICEACRRPTRAESDAAHRNIAPGAGHVGKVFMSGREAVADDAMKPEYLDMFEMTPAQGGKPDDAKVYRSIASIPIRLGALPLFGVLVATSDQPGRFIPRGLQAERAGFDTVEPLRACAANLAIVLQASNLYELRRPA
jgi:hypothetical protein